MGGISGCHHFGLAAAQVTRSRDWYRRAPGFEEQWPALTRSLTTSRRHRGRRVAAGLDDLGEPAG